MKPQAKNHPPLQKIAEGRRVPAKPDSDHPERVPRDHASWRRDGLVRLQNDCWVKSTAITRRDFLRITGN